jgi:hypothetical protein
MVSGSNSDSTSLGIVLSWMLAQVEHSATMKELIS